jgi:hypothetical protein
LEEFHGFGLGTTPQLKNILLLPFLASSKKHVRVQRGDRIKELSR